MTIYIQQLEGIIREMQVALPQMQYQPWLHFLREVYPESELLKTNNGSPQAREPTAEKENRTIKECFDIRELMMIAEQNGYPTWQIKPDGHDEQDSVLFPTEKIKAISSTNLEELFQKYLTSIQARGIEASRIMITSETTILDSEGNTFTSLIYQPTLTD